MSRIAIPYDVTFCGVVIAYAGQPLEQEELQLPMQTECQSESCINRELVTLSNTGNTVGTFEFNPTCDFDSYHQAFDAWHKEVRRYIGGAEGVLCIDGQEYHAVLVAFNPVILPLSTGVNRLVKKFEFKLGQLRSDRQENQNDTF